MPADDDDLDSDDKIKSMRAVWLSMRDEEPSDKGLAALMAAARDKADELKQPESTFWQKVLAVFRKPPVLALASVTILLGGALVIANRGDKATVDERAAAPTSSSAPAPEVTRQTAGSAAPDAVAAGSAALVPAETPPEKAAVITSEPAAIPEPPKPRPGCTKPPERKEERKDARETVSQNTGVAPPPAEPEPTVEAKIATDKPTAAPVTRGPQMKPPSTQPSPGGVVAGTGADTQLRDGESLSIDSTKTADESDSGRAKSRVLQLVKQCESAAARGDCAAVKALAAKIRSEDAATYKARVVKNTSIARCLE